jgi:hypothetical protein
MSSNNTTLSTTAPVQTSEPTKLFGFATAFGGATVVAATAAAAPDEAATAPLLSSAAKHNVAKIANDSNQKPIVIAFVKRNRMATASSHVTLSAPLKFSQFLDGTMRIVAPKSVVYESARRELIFRVGSKILAVPTKPPPTEETVLDLDFSKGTTYVENQSSSTTTLVCMCVCV